MDSFALIIFGITSNIAQKYGIQALYDMTEKGLLPENISIIGNARAPKTRVEFKEYIEEVLRTDNIHHRHPIKQEVVDQLFSKIHYIDGNLDDPNFYPKLKTFLDNLSQQGIHCENRIFYLGTYPELFEDIFRGLESVGLNKQDKGWVRIMVEKPVGDSLESAQKINALLKQFFSEDQIYRLDHYLGKETIQNILAFRFANGLFEPLLNKDYIDHIQISALEDFGIGKRGKFYDVVGALKDTGQNHQLQMLALATMDAPSQLSNEAITKERLKILENLVPIPEKTVFGQYESYTSEENIDPNSQTETFYALKTEINNERFKGVPIYIRAGKKLGIGTREIAEIAIVFKPQPDRLLKEKEQPNVLIYRIQPNEGIVFKIYTKKPGHVIELEPEYMQYCYPHSDEAHSLPDPYEKLFSDTIRGDQTFFNDAKEVEAQWSFIDPLIAAKKRVPLYKDGSMGPKEADQLIEADGRKWLDLNLDFCKN
jgi:glucose-6-phosphate 1-dehydrogenase